ncbi:hypothetical protein KIW84_035270 [Lathyrus oleraceus]|uniref:60S ribosomal protein L7a n=1 Tax=Pisum sativum TaxID=3888 RepID=A0A9D4Y534_PEA|nr:hypothetical protein KIW84_035270 [Pisum sativum]
MTDAKGSKAILLPQGTSSMVSTMLHILLSRPRHNLLGSLMMSTQLSLSYGFQLCAGRWKFLCIVKGKTRLGTIVHKKTASVLCLTTVKNEDKMEFSRILEAIKANFNDKITALHCAASGGSVNVVDAFRLLITADAHVSCVDADGNLPFDVIVCSFQAAEIKAVLEELHLDNGSDNGSIVEFLGPVSVDASSLGSFENQMPTANDSEQSGKAKTCINFNLLYHVTLT